MKKISMFTMSLFVAVVAMAQDSLVINQDCKKGVVRKSYLTNGFHRGYQWVDLDLPSGLKWAACNVGAATPSDYGDHFAWGETVGFGKSDPSNDTNKKYTGGSTIKTYYSWETYKHGDFIDSVMLNKYTNYDKMDVLLSVDDAASANMGGNWRMPTYNEQEELADNCYWEWTENYNGNGVRGYIVYKVKDVSDKGKLKSGSGTNSTTTTVATYTLADTHIFLPAAGDYSYSKLYAAGEEGIYWSSSIGEFETTAADGLFFKEDGKSKYSGWRYSGMSVRGVLDLDYTIGVKADGCNLHKFRYEYGDTFVMTAVSGEGYYFTKWSDGVTLNPRTETVTDTVTYTAIFKPYEYNIDVDVNDDTRGNVIGSGVYEYSKVATLLAIPAAGNHFVRWSDGNTDNPRYLKVTGNKSLTCIFEEGKPVEEVQGETVTIDGMTVTPFETKTEFVWSEVPGAETYSLIIWTDESHQKKECTFVFDTYGELKNVDFTQGVHQQGLEDFNFTVTGLKKGVQYAYTLSAMDSEGEVVETKQGVFSTMSVNGIDNLAAMGINVYIEGRTIIVENAIETIVVSDASGRVIGKDNVRIDLTGIRKFPVPSSGVYIVKIGNNTVSVLVK